MFYIVNKLNNMIVSRCDGWDMEGQRQLERDAKRAGYKIVDREITFMGDMVVWVEF